MLQFKNLTIYRNGKNICRDLFLDIGKGSCLIITGKNGSGKSTVLSCLTGQLKPTSGQILLDHHDIHHLSNHDKKLFLGSSGIVFQHESLLPLDSVSVVIGRIKGDLKETHEMLLALEIPDHALVHELSYSQRKKLELALSLLKHPKLILWDEPFLGLDPLSQERIKSFLLKEKQLGATIIISTLDENSTLFLNPEKLLKL